MTPRHSNDIVRTDTGSACGGTAAMRHQTKYNFHMLVELSLTWVGVSTIWWRLESKHNWEQLLKSFTSIISWMGKQAIMLDSTMANSLTK